MFRNEVGNNIRVEPTSGNNLVLVATREAGDINLHLTPRDALKLIEELTRTLLLIDELRRNDVVIGR